MDKSYPFKWAKELPRHATVLGEGQFLSDHSQPIALTEQLLKIAQGEYVTRVLSSHIQSLAALNSELAGILSQSTVYYVLGKPKDHPDGKHIIIPFKTFYELY